MTATVATSLGRPDRMLGANLCHRKSGHRQVTRASQRQRRGRATASASGAEWPEREAMPVSGPASPPGVIGGAVIKAARRSAHLTRLTLARMLNVSSATARAWENGTIPLFCLPYDQLRQLAEALNAAGARVGQEPSELLLLASRCDLLVTGMLHGFEDYAEVPPIDEDGTEAETARELLRWALAGAVPERYHQYAPPGPLLATNDVDLFAFIAYDLQAGTHGHDLTDYGSVLLALAGH
jgi:transcriptional regulator with XRE-family HTH domain